jgi:GntR family transcriptional repressor for pyruvate dehydrogenase complex
MECVKRRKIQRKRIHEDIVVNLLDDVKNGVYKIGDELPSERDLMDEFQVGRPAIRESLLKLERMGIIETSPGVRARIRKPSVRPLLDEMGDVVKLNLMTEEGQKHFQDARCFFESSLARNAAKAIDDTCLDRLKELLDSEAGLIDDIVAFAETDLEFHEIIADVSGNPIFTVLYRSITNWLLDQRLVTLEAEGQPARALEAHVRIYRALLSHDPDLAEAAMADHLTQIQALHQSMMNEKKLPLPRAVKLSALQYSDDD